MAPIANPQLDDPEIQNAPDSLGRVYVRSCVNVARSNVPKNVEVLSPNTSSPVLATLNLVVPEELAAIKSPAFVLFTISDALLPMPPLIDSGAGVLVLDPMFTPLSKSEVNVNSPVPFGVRVRL